MCDVIRTRSEFLTVRLEVRIDGVTHICPISFFTAVSMDGAIGEYRLNPTVLGLLMRLHRVWRSCRELCGELQWGVDSALGVNCNLTLRGADSACVR